MRLTSALGKRSINVKTGGRFIPLVNPAAPYPLPLIPFLRVNSRSVLSSVPVTRHVRLRSIRMAFYSFPPRLDDGSGSSSAFKKILEENCLTSVDRAQGSEDVRPSYFSKGNSSVATVVVGNVAGKTEEAEKENRWLLSVTSLILASPGGRRRKLSAWNYFFYLNRLLWLVVQVYWSYGC